MSICACGQVSVPLGKVSVQVFGTVHGVTACGPPDRHWKDRAEQAEAKIQKVRELADSVANYHGEMLPRIKPRDIYRALDGDNDE